jgi:hypothetical protein
MYQFRILRNDDKSYRLELGGINMIVDGIEVKDQRHYIKNPKKAIAFFSIDGHLYGVTNRSSKCNTAEAFYEVMRQQYSFFR